MSTEPVRDEPDTRSSARGQRPEDPFTLLVQAAAETRGDLQRSIDGIRVRLDADGERAEQREEASEGAISAFMDQVKELEQAYGRGLAKALGSLGALRDADSLRHEEITGLLTELSAATVSEADTTRRQLTDATAHARTLLVHTRDTKASVVNLEHVTTTAVAMARDQTHERIAALSTEHTRAAESAALAAQDAQEVLTRLQKSADDHGAVLGKTSFDVDQLTRAVPVNATAVMDAVSTASEQDRRAALDIEGRITQAVTVAHERTEGAIRHAARAVEAMGSALGEAEQDRALAKKMTDAIGEDVRQLAVEFDAQSQAGATAAGVLQVRDEVSALGELLAATTTSFEGAVGGAVETLTLLRTAWGEETRRVLVTLEEMGRVFLEKANAAEHARDDSVIELGRRVARLELDRPQAITTGS